MIGVQQIYATKTSKYVYKKCMENIKVHMKTRTFTGNKTKQFMQLQCTFTFRFPGINNNLKNRVTDSVNYICVGY